MKKKIFVLMFSILALIAPDIDAQYAASNFSLIGYSDPETTVNSDSVKYSGCWGWYQATKNREYAIACSHRGTYWIDITVPSSPKVCAYRAGKKSGCTWREAKSYQNYLYVISDDWGVNSFQIFDMQYLPDSVHKVYDGTNLFRQGHTLWIDGNRLYVASVSTANTYSSMCVYSLANPASPVKLRALDQDYPFINTVHDMFVRNDTVYASCAYQGLYVFKFTGTAFTMLGSLTSYTASGYNHSSALTPDGKTLVFADEVPASLPFKVADVTNLSNIQVLATANQYTKTTPHNPFVPNNELCFMSSYEDGLQLYDISTPSVPVLAGYFDTYPQGGGNVNSYLSGNTYMGLWGCYPFFPSGNIFALDGRYGGFILRTPLYGGPYVAFDSILPSVACIGSSVTASVLAVGATSLSWSGAGLFVSPATGHSATVTFSATGVHSIIVTGTGSGSTTSAVHAVTVIAAAAAVTFTNPSCLSCNDGVIKISPTSGTPPFSYSWSPGSGTGSLATNLSPGCYTIAVTDSTGCATEVQACLVGSSVGVNKFDSDRTRIYPNPVHDRLFVEMPAGARKYIVYNLLGEQVLSGVATAGEQEVQVSALPQGLYVLDISMDKGRRLINFVVE